MAIPIIHILGEPNTRGLPLSVEGWEPVGLSNPQEMLERLGAEAIARRVLACVSSQSRHWRYFLFMAPAEGKGRPIVVPRRLLSVLDQTPAQLSGICRDDWRRLQGDGRRKRGPLFKIIEERFNTYYRTPAEAFWNGVDDEDGRRIGPASNALRKRARDYVLQEDYHDFFERSSASDGLRSMFHARLRSFWPNGAKLLAARQYDIGKAARGAAYWPGLTADDRRLFLTWALIQAYYGLHDDGLEPENNNGEEQDFEDGEDAYLEGMAKAALSLLQVVKPPGKLNGKQLATIRQHLKGSLKANGQYLAPVLVYPTKADGRRRRIFPGLRLWAYSNLLNATRPPKS